MIQDQFAGALIGARKERTDHDRTCASGQRLGHIAGILDAAIGNDGNPSIFRGAKCFSNSGNLRYSRSGDDARSANGTGTDADFNPVGSGARQFASAVEGGDVAGQ